MRVNPYLIMDGNVREAVSFYQKVFGAELVNIQSFGDMPANPEFPLPDAAKELIAHAMLKIGDTELMFSDAFPGQPVRIGDNVQVCVTTDSAEKSKAVFAALADGGTIQMPIQETFWSPAYGIVTDKFGISFQVTTHPAQ
ncbi:VOC family protein [Paenibacillus sp.]|uniref:VOC family protein n=1 Tax=Paenibacillus sp. TaxID=58172 RepID=UPI002D6B611A|nr:VOC family protein [Paenibacillus sp.]HZG86865.1 VOC family protein [Paenibacillus sp.]